MKLKYFLILSITAFILLTVGCDNPGNMGNSKNIGDESDKTVVTDEDKNTADNNITNDDKSNDNEDLLKSVDLSLKPNELGEIMILMYHGVGQEESAWQRSCDKFRKDLEYMYQNGYRMISLNDYAKGNIDTEAGYTPIILTFDDGRQNNFNLIESDNGLVIDPDCAVGILEEYKKKYSDFDVTASFFLGTNIFGQKEYEEKKLKWLIDNGYDVGNHTYNHKELGKMDREEVIKEIGSENNILKNYIPDYDVETIALPDGSNPKEEYLKNLLKGEYDGVKYENIAVLDVGWRPDYSPFDILTDFASLYRVTASEINVDGCGMYDYFKQFEENKRERFISDGNPDVVTIPKRHEKYLNIDMVGSRKVNIYE